MLIYLKPAQGDRNLHSLLLQCFYLENEILPSQQNYDLVVKVVSNLSVRPPDKLADTASKFDSNC